MAVQEYLIDEVRELTTAGAELDTWNHYVDILDLEGQRKIRSDNDKSPIPFPMMNLSMKHIFETLCPAKNIIRDYSKTAIPLRVLVLTGFCKDKEYFGKIEVWYDDQTPCPIVVGCDGEDKYLIARWGDELEEMAILKKKAIERRIEKRTNSLKKKISDTQHELQNITEDVTNFMTGVTSWLYD